MPLSKRQIQIPFSYSHPDLLEESKDSTVLGDSVFAKTVGAIQQISYLSSYCFELFDNLALLTDDVSDRITVATSRTCKLLAMLPAVEKRTLSREVRSELIASILRLISVIFLTPESTPSPPHPPPLC